MYQITIINKIDENTLKCFVPVACSSKPRKVFLLEEAEYEKYLRCFSVFRTIENKHQERLHILVAELELAKEVLTKIEKYEITDETSEDEHAEMKDLLDALVPNNKLEGCT